MASSEDIMSKVNVATKKWEKDLQAYDFINNLHQQTGAPRWVLALAGALVVSLFLYLGFGAGLLCNLVGFVYPAYASFKAIESPDKEDDTQWLTYWVVYAFFNIIESFADIILFWVPFYYAFKFGFLIYLFAPKTQGAKFVYTNVISKLLRKHEKSIDKVAESIKGTAASVAKEVKKNI